MVETLNFLNKRHSEIFPKGLIHKQHRQTEGQAKYLYLFHNPLSKLTKIGVTNTPKTRQGQLSTQSGMPIKLICWIEPQEGYDESTTWLESFLHNAFDKERAIGEWFRLSDEQIVGLHAFLLGTIYGEDFCDNISEVINNYDSYLVEEC